MNGYVQSCQSLVLVSLRLNFQMIFLLILNICIVDKSHVSLGCSVESGHQLGT